MTDVLGRGWQMGTIQLDAQMPARFGLTYMGSDNQEHPVFVIHRAFFGSFERFIGILIEEYAAKLPFWLAPRQVVVASIVSDADDYAAEVVAAFRFPNTRQEYHVEKSCNNETKINSPDQRRACPPTRDTRASPLLNWLG